jgi:hypothetical protein
MAQAQFSGQPADDDGLARALLVGQDEVLDLDPNLLS